MLLFMIYIIYFIYYNYIKCLIHNHVQLKCILRVIKLFTMNIIQCDN